MLSTLNQSIIYPVGISQVLIVSSKDVVTTQRPSGAKIYVHIKCYEIYGIHYSVLMSLKLTYNFTCCNINNTDTKVIANYSQ